MPQLEAWFDSELGRLLLADEKAALDDALDCLFGYHLMQLSISRRLDLSNTSCIHHRFNLSPDVNSHSASDYSASDHNASGSGVNTSAQHEHLASPVSALARFEQLPLAAESIDVAVLHHVLEFTDTPHQLLREASRAIIPRGHILVVGFNPCSLYGVSKWLLRWFSDAAQWHSKGLRAGRVKDWLRLLDFEPVHYQQGFYRPPIPHEGIMAHLSWLERWGKRWKLPLGSYYVIVARKEVTTLTPIKPLWQSQSSLPNLGVKEAAPRVSSNRSSPKF